MTNPGSTLLAVLLDRSSASRPVLPALRAGVADLLDDQAARPGSLQIVVSTGDEPGAGADGAAARAVPVGAAEARAALPATLRPRRTPALPAAADRLLDAVGAELAARDERDRPERVVVLLVGAAGTVAAGAGVDALRERIEHQRSTYAWEFALVDVAGPGARPGAATEAAAEPAGHPEPGHPESGHPESGHPESGHPGTDRAESGPAETGPAAVALAERPAGATAAERFGVPGTATLTAGPGTAGVTAALAAASEFVGRARTVRPYEPVEGFGDGERAAAAVPDTRPGWRRLLRLP